MEIRELARDVYVILTEIGNSRGDSNFGLINSSDGAVLIDADIRRWAEICEFIKSVNEQPVKYLINTHDNFDHTSANTLLAREGATIIASNTCRSILADTGGREFAEKIAQDSELREKYNLDLLSLPDITTDDRIYLHLGERTLELIFVGHAHTPGDLVLYLADDEILFAGDVLFNGCHPVTRKANINNWMKILAELRQKQIRLTVPGHGEPASGTSNLEILQRYFEIFRSRLAELKAKGFSVEEAVKQFALPEFENWGKKNWLPASIKKIYEELELE